MKTTENSTSENKDCYVDTNYYPLMFLIPAIIILTVLAFLNQRKSLWKDICGGRPGTVIPADLLGVDSDRMAIAAVFGAATGSIVSLVVADFSSEELWISALIAMLLALMVAVLYYPIFACVTARHKTIASIMGIFYTTSWFIVGILFTFDKCKDYNSLQYWFVCLRKLPVYLCELFILARFVVVLHKEIKRIRMSSGQTCSMQEEQRTSETQLANPWQCQHVENLLQPRSVMLFSKVVHYLRKIYSPVKNFRFSMQTVSVVTICCILTYQCSFLFLFLAVTLRSGKTELSHGIGGILTISTVLATIISLVSMLRFMECHKNNMLRMFKGQRSFIPRYFPQSQFMVGKSLKYASYQIGYFLWGYILLMALFLVIVGIGYSFKYPAIRSHILPAIKALAVLCSFGFVGWLVLPITSWTIFRDRSFSTDVIALNNRNVYLVFSYFYFFVGLPMGFFSSIGRILKTMTIGALMLPRIDRSVMPEGFQQYDPGFRAYICYLYVQAAFRNPVLRVFCQNVHDAIRNPKVERSKFSKSARNKWFLLITLIHNPNLIVYRRHVVAESLVGSVGSCDVKIQISQYGSISS